LPPQLLPVFHAEEVGLDELMQMTDEDLRENLGLKTGYRKKIMGAVKKRKRLLQVIQRIRSMVQKEREDE
jgi:SAM domain (Sterile alpha motif)